MVNAGTNLCWVTCALCAFVTRGNTRDSALDPTGSAPVRLEAATIVGGHGNTGFMADSAGIEDVITADFARRWWKALMANTVALVKDAALLASHDSAGRAQSLIVLAMEELAKGRWLYEAAADQWSAPLGMYGLEPRPAGDVMVPEGLLSTRQPHAEKLKVAEQFASGLAGFWSLERRMEYYVLPDPETFTATARQRNLDKQAGLYVDRTRDVISSPLSMPLDDIANAIQHTAKVVQMHLIEDHTRQQDAPDISKIDSAEDLHWVVLPYADPELFADFLDRAASSEGE